VITFKIPNSARGVIGFDTRAISVNMNRMSPSASSIMVASVSRMVLIPPISGMRAISTAETSTVEPMIMDSVIADSVSPPTRSSAESGVTK